MRALRVLGDMSSSPKRAKDISHGALVMMHGMQIPLHLVSLYFKMGYMRLSWVIMAVILMCDVLTDDRMVGDHRPWASATTRFRTVHGKTRNSATCVILGKKLTRLDQTSIKIYIYESTIQNKF